jgi:pimeloyl-ACP methyl ester carboxylesterase
MPKVKANNLTINYDQQGDGEPLILIPYLAADSACYAFQVAEYSKHFTCISLDLRGTGKTDKPEDDYSIELLADDVAALMQALGIQKAHISGLSLGRRQACDSDQIPRKVKSLSLHGGPRPTFHKDSGRGMAGDGKSAEECAGDGHFEYLPVVPDT